MATLLLSTPSPSSAIIPAPGTVNLNYTISGNDPTDVKISYHLDPGTNVFFDDSGTPVKELIQQVHLTNPPLTIRDTVSLIKTGSNPDFSLCHLHIDALDLNNSDTDHQIFTIHFN